MGFNMRCKKCKKKCYGWATTEKCEECGGELEEVKEEKASERK